MTPTANAMAQALQHHQAGSLSQAEALYRRVLDAEPEHVPAMYLLGVVCQVLGKVEESIDWYRRCLLFKADFAEVYNNLGVAHASQGRLDEAIASYREAVRLKPDYAEAFNNLGFLEASREDWSQALDCYQRALALRPQYPEALNNLGIAHFQQHRQDEAVRCFREALALRPEYSEAHTNLGNVFLSQGNHAEAGNCYRQALRSQPDNAKTHYNLGVVHAALKQWAEAAACWQRSLALDGEDPQAHRSLGYVFHLQGKNAEALACYHRLLALKPEDGEARYLTEALRGPPPSIKVQADYTTNLFDSYADHFDHDLVERLGYRGPELMKEALGPDPPERSLAVLDLGCGTGLCGLKFRSWANTLIGVDLSDKMLARARDRGIYDELILGDLLGPLREREGQLDLVLAGDVLIYLGDLGPLFQAVYRALRPGGRFAFTVELLEGTGYRLLPTVRFAHSLGYLQELAVQNQMCESCANQVVLRTESDQGVAGLVVVMFRQH